MLLYDNRGRIRLTLQIYGSIYSRTWQFFLLILVYSCILIVIADSESAFQEYFRVLFPSMEHPFVAASSATLIAFSVSFRTNIAWNRFWEACQQTSIMFSKWNDAYLSLISFINSTIALTGGKKSPDYKYLTYCRGEVTHYFSVLSALASARLVRGDIRRMEMRRAKGVAWEDQIALRENLNSKDLTGAESLVSMRAIPVPSTDGLIRDDHRRTDRSVHSHTDRTSGVSHGLRVSGTESKDNGGHRRKALKMGTKSYANLKDLYSRGMSLNLRESWEAQLSIIGELSARERKALDASKDRVSLVIMWIIELVGIMQPKLKTPPPIITRLYQEMSNGGLGFSQAEKLSDIPFPFIFAQLLNVMLMCFTLYSPLVFVIFTGVSWVTPILSTLTVFNFWALNEIAKELENPFGDEANNVPVIALHERFVEALLEMHTSILPADRTFKEEEEDEPDLRHRRSMFGEPYQPSKERAGSLVGDPCLSSVGTTEEGSGATRKRATFADEKMTTSDDFDQCISEHISEHAFASENDASCDPGAVHAFKSEVTYASSGNYTSARCSDVGDSLAPTKSPEGVGSQKTKEFTWAPVGPGSVDPEPPTEEQMFMEPVGTADAADVQKVSTKFERVPSLF